jgi:poly(beta-D-mannuronate) C5 epimerase
MVLLFMITGLIPYGLQQKHNPPFSAEAGEKSPCIGYDAEENTITINCDSSFLDVVKTLDDPTVFENLGNGEYLLNANLEVADDVTFEMSSSSSNADNGAVISDNFGIGENGAENGGNEALKYLKITGANGIVVYGRIEISGVKITSWNPVTNSPISQTINGSIPRAYINLRGSEGGFVRNSEISYLGYQEFGRRGFDLFGEGYSHDLEISGSKFHDMWFAFYSRGAYNIVIDGDEYYDNIKYGLDPHSGTHDMRITNNYLHNNPIGAICSDRCSNILIEGNEIVDNTKAGIFFSRNMTDSIARNNHVVNGGTGILVSESPNNQVYNNIVEGADLQGIRLLNPEIPDDGVTEGNIIYNNTILNCEDGIGAAKSHNNILENNMFSGIESSEYDLSGGSSITIRGQLFDNSVITGEGGGLASDNVVEIADSGTVQIIEGAIEEGENDTFNTDIQPYSRTLDDGDSITVNSS